MQEICVAHLVHVHNGIEPFWCFFELASMCNAFEISSQIMKGLDILRCEIS
jgi:hypothetical protein